MFNDVNEVRLMGNVTNEPELKFTPSGSAVLTFGMATNRRYKKGDEWVDEPTFHNVVVWGQYAQTLSPRIKKGTRVYVSGRIQTRSWDGNDGKKQYRTEIVSDEVNLLSRYNEGTNAELGGIPQAPGGGSSFTPKSESRSSKPQQASAGEPPFAKEELEEGPEVNADIDPDDLPF